jgi:uncharacterized protein (DUF1697 family)
MLLSLPMKTFVALLAAVNVGGRKVPMSDLRTLANKLGFEGPRTYIQSGNLVFRASDSEKGVLAKLAPAMEKRFGFAIETVLRDKAEWDSYAEGCPFVEVCAKEPNRVFVLVSKAPLAKGAAAALEARGHLGEQARVGAGAVWLYCPEGIGASKLTPAVIDRLVGSKVTARNYRTVLEIQKLASLVSAGN